MEVVKNQSVILHHKRNKGIVVMKKPWILKAAVGSFLLFGLAFLILGVDALERKEEDVFLRFGLLGMLVLGCIIAPIWEELVFRGVLLKRKIVSIVALVVMLLLVVLQFHYLFLLLALVSVVLFFAKGFKYRIDFLVLSSALLFAFIHYIEDGAIQFSYAMFMQFGFGLLASWIVINYKLWHAMLAHAAYNFFFLFIIGTIPLFFIKDTAKEGQIDNYSYRFEKQKFHFNAKPEMHFSEGYIELKNISYSEINNFKYTDSVNGSWNQLFGVLNEYHLNQVPWALVNITIEIDIKESDTSDSDASNLELSDEMEKVIQVLLKEKIIEPK